LIVVKGTVGNLNCFWDCEKSTFYELFSILSINSS